MLKKGKKYVCKGKGSKMTELKMGMLDHAKEELKYLRGNDIVSVLIMLIILYHCEG